MDKLILGLLMLKRLTVYELRGAVKQYFQSMCSDSLGSIRVAVKKLRDAGLVTCEEYVEKSVNKKQYSITDKGRKEFLDWVHTPADISRFKNMELAKLLFMGFVSDKKRLPLLDEIIASLQKKLSKLLAIQSSIQISEGKTEALSFWGDDHEYRNGILKSTQITDIAKIANDVGDFLMFCLQYEIDAAKFQIEWFRQLRNEEVKKGE